MHFIHLTDFVCIIWKLWQFFYVPRAFNIIGRIWNFYSFYLQKQGFTPNNAYPFASRSCLLYQDRFLLAVNTLPVLTFEKAAIEPINDYATRMELELVRAPNLIKKEKTLFWSAFLWSGLRVSDIKTTECCFYERCSTKQGERRVGDLRRRRLTTMRLEWNSNEF